MSIGNSTRDLLHGMLHDTLSCGHHALLSDGLFHGLHAGLRGRLDDLFYGALFNGFPYTVNYEISTALRTKSENRSWI